MTSPTQLRYITTEEIKKILTMAESIRAVKDALVQLSTGQAKVPARTSIEIPEFRTTALVMPAYLPRSKRIGLKLISLCEDNPAIGLPLAQAVTIIMDAEHGTPLAVMDASYLTAVRTGAASGAATDALARKDSRVAAIFGAGVQGKTQLEAVAAVRPIRKALVFDLDPQAAALFAEEMGPKLSLDMEPASSPEDVRKADIICTATTSVVPVFSDGNLKQGVHINAIGSFKPHVREIPGDTIKRAGVFVDQRQACLEEAGDLIIPLRQNLIDEGHIRAEIGEVLAGLKPGRSTEDEVTVFKSVGNAALALAIASLVFG